MSEQKQLKEHSLAPFTCLQVMDAVSPYLDSELSPNQIRRFESHAREMCRMQGLDSGLSVDC